MKVSEETFKQLEYECRKPAMPTLALIKLMKKKKKKKKMSINNRYPKS